jgi:hypothetical protein
MPKDKQALDGSGSQRTVLFGSAKYETVIALQQALVGQEQVQAGQLQGRAPLCFAGSHLTKKSCNTGETKHKPLSQSC